MTPAVTLYDLHASPHNIKVRLALAYKKIPFAIIPVDSDHREAVIEVSGQPLTPVLVHGDTVVYDSYAITRYLDANFRSGPRLYSPDRKTMQAIEGWENFVRGECGPPVGMTFGQFFAPAPDAAKLKQAGEMINRAASRLEEALADRRCLVGEAPTAADMAVAPMIYYGALPDEVAKSNPIAGFFHKHLRIENAPKTRAWVQRIMSLEG
jgi:glutathione S-transferase